MGLTSRARSDGTFALSNFQPGDVADMCSIDLYDRHSSSLRLCCGIGFRGVGVAV
jgi:hypothetical protein